MRELLATLSGVNEPQLLCTKNTGQSPCVRRMTTNSKVSRAATCKLICDEVEFRESAPQLFHTGRECAGREFQTVVQPLVNIVPTTAADSLYELPQPAASNRRLAFSD